MRTISQRELRNDSGRVLRDLQDGEELLVSVSGTVIGVLRMDPAPGPPMRSVGPGERRRMLARQPVLTPEQRHAWRADIDLLPDPLDDPWERADTSR